MAKLGGQSPPLVLFHSVARSRSVRLRAAVEAELVATLACNVPHTAWRVLDRVQAPRPGAPACVTVQVNGDRGKGHTVRYPTKQSMM